MTYNIRRQSKASPTTGYQAPNHNFRVDMDPLSVIASTMAVTQAIATIYKAIQHLRGLPNEFNEVSRHLPMAQETLGLVRHHLQGRTLDKSSKKALQPLVSDCEEKAKSCRTYLRESKKG